MEVFAVVLAPLLGVVGIFIGYALSSRREDRNISFRARLRIHLGDDAADRFLDYQDDRRPEPRSLHYQFVVAHNAVLAAEVDKSTVDEVQARVHRLNHAWSDFADIAIELAQRARLLSEPAVS